MNNLDFCDTPLSLYSYGVVPSTHDIPYAGAGLETNVEKAPPNRTEEARAAQSNNTVVAVKETVPKIRPRSSSTSSLTRSSKQQTIVKKTPAKTVAFGLTTNINETVERVRPNLITKRLTAFRNNNFQLGAVTKAPVCYQPAEVDKKSKLQKDVFEELKNENLQLKQSVIQLQEGMSNLRHVVTKISSRLMELENAKPKYDSPIPIQASKGINNNGEPANIASTSANFYQNNENNEDLISNDQQMLDVPSKFRITKNHMADSYQPTILDTDEHRRHKHVSRIENVREQKSDEVKKLLATIEDCVRHDPKMFQRAQELFNNLATTSLMPEQEERPYREHNLPAKANILTSLNYENLPYRNGPKIKESPYNAKYKMTVQRSELITYASPRRNVSSARPTVGRAMPINAAPFASQSHRPFSTGDDVFFEQECDNYEENEDEQNYFYDDDNNFKNNDFVFNDNTNLRFCYQQKQQPIEKPVNQTESRIERRERYRRTFYQHG